jgi:hypothetical protein
LREIPSRAAARETFQFVSRSVPSSRSCSFPADESDAVGAGGSGTVGPMKQVWKIAQLDPRASRECDCAFDQIDQLSNIVRTAIPSKRRQSLGREAVLTTFDAISAARYDRTPGPVS